MPIEVLGTVIVCDDEPVNRRICVRHARNCGYASKQLADGDEILAMVKAGAIIDGQLVDLSQPARAPFAAIFLDIMMERTAGDEVVKQLRAAGMTKTPVVAATGNGLRADMDRYLAEGFSAVLLKPFKGKAVRDTLEGLGVRVAVADHA